MSLVNRKAPSAKLPVFRNNEIGEVDYLQESRGKWVVLFFYPLDFTFVCPTEIKELSKKYDDFKNEGANVYTISIDSAFSHQAWVKNGLEGMKVPMISDINKELTRSFEILHPIGASFRGTFIIDPEGVVQAEIINNLNVGRNVNELLRTLKAFKTGELCPVNWQPGEPVLTTN